MQRLLKNKIYWQFILAVCAGLMLTGCGAVGLSPETVAVNAVMDHPGDMTVDQSSIQVLQTLNVNDSRAIVLVFFQGTRKETGLESCLYSQGVEKWQLGWRMSNGGGGCAAAAGGVPVSDLWSGSGISHSRNLDPGTSEAHGMVYNPEITRVRVTWEDDQVNEAGVIQSSYQIARIGQMRVKNVQGLDDSGEVLYDQTPVTAPGKQ